MPDSEHMDPNQSILLLEDEPVSAEFLCAALAPLGLEICQAGSLAQARALLRQRRFSLLLLDLSLPDGGGSDLLGELRANPGSPSQSATAVALTAELDETRRAALHATGFADAWVKPIAAATLRDVVSRCLANPSFPRVAGSAGVILSAAVWDDAGALAACGGSSEVLSALRGLFLKELPDQCAKIRRDLQAGRGSESLDELHRLLAGCGFCGASDLARSARALMLRVREAADFSQAMAKFDASSSRVLGVRLND